MWYDKVMSSSNQEKLQALYSDLEKMAGKLPLAKTAQDIVPGEGSPLAEVLLIGEAPGFNEQQQRRPFVGRSGQLLRKTLEEVGLPPAEVYIANIVKARPPDNRDPLPEEIKAYKPYLDAEIAILQPKLIVTLGRFSMGKFLPDARVSQVHGRLHKVTWQGQPQFVLPMYHPAAALRGNAIKASFVADMQKIPKVLTWVKEQHHLEEMTDSVKEALFS
jgi:uracil-DNA glycosylase family 4